MGLAFHRARHERENAAPVAAAPPAEADDAEGNAAETEAPPAPVADANRTDTGDSPVDTPASTDAPVYRIVGPNRAGWYKVVGSDGEQYGTATRDEDEIRVTLREALTVDGEAE